MANDQTMAVTGFCVLFGKFRTNLKSPFASMLTCGEIADLGHKNQAHPLIMVAVLSKISHTRIEPWRNIISH